MPMWNSPVHLLQPYVYVQWLSLTLLQPHGLWPARLLHPWYFPGNNTRIGGYFLLQGFFWPRDQTLISCVSCIGRWVLHHCNTWEAPFTTMKNFKYCRYLGYEARLKVRACQVLHTRAVSLCLLQPSDFPFLQFPQEVTCFLEKLNPSISEFRIREAQ